MAVFLDIADLKKSYPTREGEAVNVEHFDLRIEKGEFICLIGHSGCGKSTVLSMLAGPDGLAPAEKAASCGQGGSDPSRAWYSLTSPHYWRKPSQKLDVIGVGEEFYGVPAPGRDVADVEGQAQAGYGLEEGQDLFGAAHHGAGPGLEARVGDFAEVVDGLLPAAHAFGEWARSTAGGGPVREAVAQGQCEVVGGVRQGIDVGETVHGRTAGRLLDGEVSVDDHRDSERPTHGAI